jgi:hypothetical protein
MKIEKVEVFGHMAAIRAMRNPMESWHNSDSLNCHDFVMGPKDLRLACSLIKAGGSHRKFLRQIIITWDITIPRMIWQEFDTYKVGVVRNSCSTMHKLGARDLEPCDFEGYEEDLDRPQLDLINRLGSQYREKKSAENLHRLKLRLPESFLQKATCTFNYEVAMRMYSDRKDHRMPEWSGPGGICDHITQLPYMRTFIEQTRGT